MEKYNNCFIKNIYYMLSYAFSTLKQIDEKEIEKEAFDNLPDLFAAILSKGISRQIKQGLYREYVNKNEALPLMRGKIDINGAIKCRINQEPRIACEFDELSENNLLNQILKSTSVMLIRSAEVNSTYKNELKKEMPFFSNVNIIELTGIRWHDIIFQRNNLSYRVLISICELLVEGMLLTTESGEYKLAKFVDDQHMYTLYEKFLLAYYEKEHPELKVSASQIPWALDDNKGTLLPLMQSDIMLEDREGNHDILIIDAKFYSTIMQKQYNKESLRSGHLYQIFTYVKNKEMSLINKGPKVSGMLLYAKTDEELQPDNSYQMSGNKISVKNLDLNRDFKEISTTLDNIVKDHFTIKQ